MINDSDLKKFNIPKEKIRKKVKPTKEARRSFSLPEEQKEKLKDRRKEKLVLSFRFIDKKTEEFNLGGVESDDYYNMIEKFQKVCDMNKNKFFKGEWQKFRPYKHKSREKFEVNLNDDFWEQVDLFQFRLSKTNRVHFTIIGNIIYIIWLDFHHNLKLTDKYPSKKIYKYPRNKEEKLRDKISRLKDKNEVLEEENSTANELINKFVDNRKYECELCDTSIEINNENKILFCEDCFNKYLEEIIDNI